MTKQQLLEQLVEIEEEKEQLEERVMEIEEEKDD